MTTKEIEKCIMLLFCMFMLLLTIIIGIITGMIKIKQDINEIKQNDLEVHEYIFNRIETK